VKNPRHSGGKAKKEEGRNKSSSMISHYRRGTTAQSHILPRVEPSKKVEENPIKGKAAGR